MDVSSYSIQQLLEIQYCFLILKNVHTMGEGNEWMPRAFNRMFTDMINLIFMAKVEQAHDADQVINFLAQHILVYQEPISQSS
jgi:hypothetical protein